MKTGRTFVLALTLLALAWGMASAESVPPEIPKPGFGGTMTASAAASYLGTVVGAVIDGTPADALGARWSGNSWERPKEYAWLRIDLGLRYRVQKISIAGDRPGQGPDSVKVFVTDSDVTSSAPPAAIMPEWGDALVDDTWPADGTEKSADLLGTGRYVIIYTNGLPNGLYIKEVWLYGVQLERKPTVTAFTIADLSTGSHLFTNEATVNVSISSEPSATETPVAAVLVTETADKPPVDDPNWSASITSYTIAGPEGSRALYAWAKDTADAISDAFITTIYFSTATPAVSGIEVTDNGNGTATAEWATDNPAEGSMKYGSVSILGATPNVAMENAFRTSHSVTFPIAAGTNYKIILVNNEIASAPVYWPRPWPIEGDANMDCRVNILDLIFIRNKLNLDVASGDNWKADVNEDARINILDLIYVRNKLNTQCP